MPSLLKLTTEQRKSLYKWWWKGYTWMDPENCDSNNPNKDNLEMTTEQWLNDQEGEKFELADPETLINKYRPKFVLWAQKRVKKNGGWPKIQNRTSVIKEFLARGFVHTFDVLGQCDKYTVVTLIGELQWPVYFDLHQDALDCSKRFGIPGYTKCPIPGK